MLRVLHMIGSLEIGGSQSLIMNIYRKIDRDEIQFDFIVDHPERDFFKKEIESLGGQIYYFPNYKGWNIKEIRQVWERFFDEHPGYTIFHSHVRSYASLYIPIAKKYGLKTIIHSHNTANGRGIRSIAKMLLQYPLRYQADYYMACSARAGEWLFGKKVVSSNNFFILINGIDTQKFSYSEEFRDLVRKQLKISDDTFVLGFLARVVEQKNPEFVIEIFKKLITHEEDTSKIKLLFVGDGDRLENIKQLAKKYDISKYIIFLGQRTDTAQLMMAMDVYLLPSLWEGFGITLIEAQATGLYCLCSPNIQEEVIITDKVVKLSISNGVNDWIEEIQKVRNARNFERYNMQKLIERAGYDIMTTTKWLTNFYLRLDGENT